MSNWMIAKENILNLGSSSLFVKTPKMRDSVINSKSVYRHLYAFKIIHVYMIKFGSNFFMIVITRKIGRFPLQCSCCHF